MHPEDDGERCNFDIKTSGCTKYLIKVSYKGVAKSLGWKRGLTCNSRSERVSGLVSSGKMVTDEFEKECKFTAYIISGLVSLKKGYLLKYKMLYFQDSGRLYVLPNGNSWREN